MKRNYLIPLFLLFTSSFIFATDVMVTQYDGFHDVGYVFGANGISKLSLDGQVDIVNNAPLNVRSAVAFGQVDIAIFCEDGAIYCFNTITSTLRKLKRPEGLTTEMEATLTSAQAKEVFGFSRPGFGVVNYTILFIYLVVLVIMGFYFSRNEKSTDDFFLAGRRIPSWAAGLSIFGTQLSAITFMAMPAKSYSSDWRYLIGNMAILFIAAPITAIIFIPFYRRLNVTTAYEYLEKRFNLAVRLTASFIYIIMQLLRMGIVLFIPALALSTVTGMDIRLTIILMGVLCTVYTVLGGIEAVIWTDVIQVIVLLTGAFLCLLVIIFDIGSDLMKLTEMSFIQNKFSVGYLDLNFNSVTIIVILLSIQAAFCPYVSDQTVVQRYLTTKDIKQAQKSLWINAWMVVPSTLMFLLIGTLLYMFYFNNPDKLNIGMSNDSIFPWFILNELPAGVSGLLIAGIFAAAMSSLDSSLNSVSAAIISDFVVRFKSSISEHRRLVLARWLTVLLGGFGTITALIMTIYDIKSFWDLIGIIVGPFLGTLGGLFILGACTKRCNAIGGLVGMTSGVLMVYFVQFKTSLHFFLYTIIAVMTTYIVGYIISFLTGSNTKSVDNLSLIK